MNIKLCTGSFLSKTEEINADRAPAVFTVDQVNNKLLPDSHIMFPSLDHLSSAQQE